MPPHNFPTKAMVLAAGRGTRMRPLTSSIPKPMVEVAGKSLIHRMLDQLARSGITEAVVNLSHMADQLEQHLKPIQNPKLTFSFEEEPLETGGGIAKALPLLGDKPFFSTNSDVIYLDGVTPALHRLAEHWNDGSMDALLLLVPSVRAYGYTGQGDFHLTTDGRIRRRKENDVAPFVFTGVQLMHPRLFKGCPAGAFSLNVLYNRAIDTDGTLERVCGIAHDGVWLHVGDPQSFAFAEHYLSQ